MFITNPTASASLSFRGNGSGGTNQSIFSIGVGNGTERLDIFNNDNSPFVTIASTGNVGIGTTNVDAKFEVVGTASISGVMTLSDDIAFTANKVIRRNTSDGSDSGSLYLTGGGASGAGRGGKILLAGNEHADAGKVQIRPGAGSSFIVQNDGDTSNLLTINESDGSATFTSSFNGDDVWFFDHTGTTDTTGTEIIRLDTSVAATSTSIRYMRFLAGNLGTEMGRITANNNAVAFNTTSDKRLKNLDGPTARGLDVLRQIAVYDGSWKNDPESRVLQMFSAQQLLPFYPEAVSVGGDDPTTNPWGVDYGRLTPLIIKSVQELDAKTASLSFRIEDLEARIASQSQNMLTSEVNTSPTSDVGAVFGFIVSKFNEIFGIVFEKGLMRVANIVAEKIKSDSVETRELCLEDFCVTKEKLKALFEVEEQNMPTSEVNIAPTSDVTGTEQNVGTSDVNTSPTSEVTTSSTSDVSE